MDENAKLEALRKAVLEIEDTADCAVGLDSDNMKDALKEIRALVRALPRDVLPRKRR